MAGGHAAAGRPHVQHRLCRRRGNVGYVYNARIPRRAEGYDWSQYLPGDTKETLWTDYLPYDQLPQVWNPPSGVVSNSNSSPFAATLGPGNPDPGAFPKSAGIETYLTNRALRVFELFGQDNAITASAFDRIKYDTRYSAQSNVARRLRALLDGPPPQAPLARKGSTCCGAGTSGPTSTTRPRRSPS